VSEVMPLGNHRFLVTSPDGAQRVACAIRGDGGMWVCLAGRTYVIADVTGPPSRTTARDDADALAAPMPATVVAVNVDVGSDVAQGDVLIVLEAMKMELPITAPRAARVRRLLCRAGELVQPGSPLVELE
jgi:biotin carboxyl carrier protein